MEQKTFGIRHKVMIFFTSAFVLADEKRLFPFSPLAETGARRL